ncbi:MAG: HD domain-containing protein [Candidatus Goldbacteria bacterium]|nr:HD domain-containing protein [Candidatus Goldiibacteriota bacterium]
MKRKKTEKLNEKDIIAIDVYDHSGKILVKASTPVSSTIIKKLKDYNIPFAYVQDDSFHVSYIFDREDIVQLLRVLWYFVKSNGQNSEILKIYNLDEIRMFAEYNNEVASKIAYGHIFKFFISKLYKKVSETKNFVYDFIDYRVIENYLFFHSVNVAAISILIGCDLGLEEKEIIDLGVGALLYDLSMSLYKFIEQKRPLDAIEKEEMQQHVFMGYDAAKNIYGISSASALIAYQHHERNDGSGYPKKLKDEEISFLTKIVSVADVYDALISNRPFRIAYNSDEAWNYIVDNSGVLFDEKVVDSFKKIIPKYIPGDIVELSDGKKAVIVKNIYNKSEQPVIKLFEKKDKGDIILKEEINLSEKKDIFILRVIETIR